MVKEIKLGYCPHCGSDNYTRTMRGSEGDFVSMNCCCVKCEKSFTEYFGLDEVKFNKKGEEFIYNNCLTKEEKETILKAMNLLIDAENDSKDYTRIINVMGGGLNSE